MSAAAAVCDGQLVYSTPTTVVLAAVFALLAVVTIAGNTLVVAAFSTDAKLRSFGNYFILNLAVSDLVVGLLIAVYAPHACQSSVAATSTCVPTTRTTTWLSVIRTRSRTDVIDADSGILG